MKHYSKEFKEEALKLSDEIGVKKTAQQLGIAYYTLADWRSIRRNAMQWAVADGIVNGSNGKLNPQNNATRAQVAAILMRFCEMSK